MCHKVRGVILLLAVFNIAQAQENSCVTAHKEKGNCINIKQCPPLLDILKSPNLQGNDITYLQQSQCGFDGNEPKVCCALRNKENSCSTPNSQNGYCINIKQCQPLLDILKLSNRNENDTKYLIQSQCGYDGKDPKVCCPSETDNLLPSNCGQDLSTRIIGGTATALDEFPWLTLLEYLTPTGLKLACGGALISKRYVLTAAHCLMNVPNTWSLQSVRLGEHNTATHPDCIQDSDNEQTCSEDPITVRVEEQIFHESYVPSSRNHHNDIALLRLVRDVNPTNYIRPICLPDSSNIGNLADVAGWGRTENKAKSDVKLKVTVPIVDRNRCQVPYRQYGVSLIESQICAGGDAGKDSCKGDSGGPLMRQVTASDGTKRWTSIGIVSFGHTPCGLNGWPGVYTKVYNYMPWILSKIRP